MLMAAAVAAPPSPKTQAKAAASLVEAGTSGDGQEELGPSGDKKRKSRKKKDPAAPKKALTAYLVFINGKRDQVIKEHPEADLKDQVGLQLLLCAFPSCLSFWRMVREKQPSRPGQKAASAQLYTLVIHSLPGQQSHVSVNIYCYHGAGAATSCALAADQSSRQGGLRSHCLCRQGQVIVWSSAASVLSVQAV
jgi:hypothetical protein